MDACMRVSMQVVVMALWLIGSGCGGDDAPASVGGDAGGGGGEDALSAASCGQPDIPGNEVGVGTYCSPSDGTCPSSAPLCLAVLVPEEGHWYCTRTCSTDEQCGTGAVCLGDERGRACVPARCDPGSPDGGVAE
jgi:hypothetical protein